MDNTTGIINWTWNVTKSQIPAVQIQEVMSQYCNSSLTKIIILGAIAGLLWLVEPGIKKFIEQSNFEDNYFISKTTIMFMYKWLGLGLLFMTIYVMSIMRQCLV